MILLEYQNIFAEGYTPNWSEEVVVIKKVKNTVPSDLKEEEIVGQGFTKTNCKKNKWKTI